MEQVLVEWLENINEIMKPFLVRDGESTIHYRVRQMDSVQSEGMLRREYTCVPLIKAILNNCI